MRLFFPLSGDDVFISYSRQDGSLYAAGLADELTKKNLSCFIDKLGTEPNHDLPDSLKKKIRNCTVFVLVGTKKAAQSRFVEKEIVEFKKTGRTFLPIDFNKSIGSAIWYDQIPGISTEPEKLQTLKTGDPSDNVVSFIEKSFNYTRRNQYMFRMFVGALSLFFILIGLGVGSYLFAVNRANAAQKRADEQTKRADEATQQADVAEKRARIQEQVAVEKEVVADIMSQRAADETKKANDAQKLADEKTKLAEQKNQEAIQANNLAQEKIKLAQEAEKRQKDAEINAARQERIAFSREQASNSIALLPFDPEQSLLLAGQAYKTEKTPQAEFALQRSIFDSRIKVILKGHRESVFDAHFDSSGQLAVTTGNDGTVRIWNAQSGEEIKKLGDKGNFTQVALSPNGRYIAAVDKNHGGAVHFWDLENKTEEHLLTVTTEDCKTPGDYSPYCTIEDISFSEDSQYIAGGAAGVVSVWKTDTRQPEKVLPTPGNWIDCVKFSPDGKYILSAGKQVILWDWKAAQSPSNPHIFPALAEIRTVAFDSNGEFFVVTTNEVLGDGTYSGQADGEAWIWSTKNPTEQPIAKLKGHSSILNDAQFNPDGDLIVTTSEDRTARVWNWKAQQSEQKQIILRGHTERVRNAQFSRDGQYIVTSSDDGTARIWKPGVLSITDQKYREIVDIQSLATLRGHIDNIWRAEFSRDGKSIITASEDGTARIWNANVETVLREFPLVSSASISPDNKLIATANPNKPIQIWDDWQNQTTGNPVAELRINNSVDFSNPIFSYDGNFVAAIHQGANYIPDSVVIWNWKSEPQKLIPLRGNHYQVNQIAFSSDPESRYLLAASGSSSTITSDNILRVWAWRESNVRVLKLSHPQCQSGPVRDAVFSKDNKFIVSSNDSVVCVWEWQSETNRNNPIILEAYTRGTVRQVDISSDGRYIAATVGDGDFVNIWDWQSENGRKNPIKLKYSSNFKISDIAFSSDSNFLLMSSGDGTLSLWDAGTGLYISTIGSYNSGNTPNRSISLGQDGKYILVSGIQTFERTKIVNRAKVYYCELCSDVKDIFTLIPKYVSPQSILFKTS